MSTSLTLTPAETFWLTWHSAHSRPAVARLARAVLAGEAVPAFAEKRLAALPRPTLTLEALLNAAQVDLAHARHVADHALRLFHATTARHRLPPAAARWVEWGALAHNLAYEVDAPAHHLTGQAMWLAARVTGLTALGQAIIACVIRLHRKRPDPSADPVFTALTPTAQSRALAVSALVRAADGLDYSETQTSRLVEVYDLQPETRLYVQGAHAALETARATRKADLWQTVLAAPLYAVALPAPPPPFTLDDTLDVWLQNIFAEQLARWRSARPGALHGEVAALKSARAAARRLRAALKLCAPLMRPKASRRLRETLKSMEDTLGAVRDLDVLLAEARRYAAKHGLNLACVPAWEQDRQRALRRAGRALAGPALTAWESALMTAQSQPPTRPNPPTLRQAAPALLTRALEQLHARHADLDPADPDSFHAVRLALKPCRFALEFLAPALGPAVQPLIDEVVAAQTAFGDFNDLWVLCQALQAFPDKACRAYARSRQRKLRQHQDRLTATYTRAYFTDLHNRLLALVAVP